MRRVIACIASCLTLAIAENNTIPLPLGYNMSYPLPVANPPQAIPTLAPGYDFSTRQDDYDEYNAIAFKNQMAILEQRQSGCTSRNVIVRKEWSQLSMAERTNYTDAVNCLRKLPPITSLDYAPGVRNRFDDFHVNHINATVFVHNSAYFWPWHRYYMHSYEKALRDECGYTGGQPYWDWSANEADPASNALFTEPGGIGSNGVVEDHVALQFLLPTYPPKSGLIPPGTGGGCVVDGPFANMIQNLGPYGPPVVTNAYEYNPRCITRDFRPLTMKWSNTYANITHCLDQTNFEDFDDQFEGVINNPHGGGHTGIGGTNTELFAGNGDPSFYFHHTSVDHLWTIWQAQDLANRTYVVTKTLTIRNSPPSENGTMNTTMDVGYNGPPLPAYELASTIDGPFCYIYAATNSSASSNPTPPLTTVSDSGAWSLGREWTLSFSLASLVVIFLGL